MQALDEERLGESPKWTDLPWVVEGIKEAAIRSMKLGMGSDIEERFVAAVKENQSLAVLAIARQPDPPQQRPGAPPPPVPRVMSAELVTRLGVGTTYMLEGEEWPRHTVDPLPSPVGNALVSWLIDNIHIPAAGMGKIEVANDDASDKPKPSKKSKKSKQKAPSAIEVSEQSETGKKSSKKRGKHSRSPSEEGAGGEEDDGAQMLESLDTSEKPITKKKSSKK